ncbi:hypothetical protein BMS3Bbin04_01279 [bacterium BMS3Bbin04]|nr:hypothetical protein BMS3Bbin04_01279 [bacterium BMS3Bbin04]
MLELNLAHSGYVQVTIVNVLGREVSRPVASWHQRGTQRLMIDADYLPAGIYFVRVVTGDGFSQVRKILLLP